MYYPYLRARQFELLSLRELAAEHRLDPFICPVIEPVNKSFRNLELANDEFTKQSISPYLIINPLVGEIKGDTDKVINFYQGLNHNSFQPAFHFNDNKDYITQIVSEYQLTNCLLIGLDSFVQEDALEELASQDEISHVMLFEPHRYRSLDRKLKTLSKNYIRLDNPFEKLSRNADYLPIPAHRFSEEHIYYEQDGYQGFADFTPLSKEYSSSGFTPRAVTIHLTYINSNSNNEIWIRHFTSESNDSTANVQGKFEEAASKAIRFCKDYPLINSATQILFDYYSSGLYPGLGTVKKVSIKNHLLIVYDYLKSV